MRFVQVTDYFGYSDCLIPQQSARLFGTDVNQSFHRHSVFLRAVRDTSLVVTKILRLLGQTCTKTRSNSTLFMQACLLPLTFGMLRIHPLDRSAAGDQHDMNLLAGKRWPKRPGQPEQDQRTDRTGHHVQRHFSPFAPCYPG